MFQYFELQSRLSPSGERHKHLQWQRRFPSTLPFSNVVPKGCQVLGRHLGRHHRKYRQYAKGLLLVGQWLPMQTVGGLLITVNTHL